MCSGLLLLLQCVVLVSPVSLVQAVNGDLGSYESGTEQGVKLGDGGEVKL